MEYSACSVANVMIRKAHESNEDITHLKVQKLVYFCHAWMLAIHKRPLLDEPVEAWRFGPVIASLYNSLRRYGRYPIEHQIAICESVEFDEDALRIMEQVWNIYGKHSASKLSALTHQPGSPWEQVHKKLGTFAVVPDPLIRQHYEQYLNRD